MKRDFIKTVATSVISSAITAGVIVSTVAANVQKQTESDRSYVFASYTQQESFDVPETNDIRYGVVLAQLFEGWAESDDYYLIEVDTTEMFTINGDDLNVGDPVTLYYIDGAPVRMLYGFR